MRVELDLHGFAKAGRWGRDSRLLVHRWMVRKGFGVCLVEPDQGLAHSTFVSCSSSVVEEMLHAKAMAMMGTI